MVDPTKYDDIMKNGLVAEANTSGREPGNKGRNVVRCDQTYLPTALGEEAAIRAYKKNHPINMNLKENQGIDLKTKEPKVLRVTNLPELTAVWMASQGPVTGYHIGCSKLPADCLEPAPQKPKLPFPKLRLLKHQEEKFGGKLSRLAND